MLIVLPFFYLLQNDQRSVETSFLSVIFTGLNLLRDDFFKRSAMYKENIPTISFQQGSNKPRD